MTPHNTELSRTNIRQESISFIADALCSTQNNKKGFFSLLEDSDTFDDILDAPQLSSDIQAQPVKTHMSPYLPVYVGCRHFLRQRGVDSRDVADYVAAVCVHFVYAGQFDDNSTLLEPMTYVDNASSQIQQMLWANQTLQALEIQIHISNYILFLTGMLPRAVESRQLEGEYPSHVYEELGIKGYSTLQEVKDPKGVFETLSTRFTDIKNALNDLSNSAFV
jgi:hypothetical protein